MAIFHVIDDEKFMCDLISKMLGMHGHETLTFQDPRHYLDYLDRNRPAFPAAVITDVLMLTMDGYELINEVLQRNEKQKFIVVSGTPHIDPRTRHKACHYLCKPFRVSELIDMIKSIERCNDEGASPAIGCSKMGNRKQFISEWHCPVPQSPRSKNST
jgi:DNA-binding NtrC family response regulator